jgi:endonuclease/exonuclease/phosphatase (EEP) superfamily protein YafD
LGSSRVPIGLPVSPGAIVLFVGLVAGLAALGAGQLASWRIEFDIFNHFVPHIAILILACLIGLAMPRAGLAGAFAAMAIGLVAIGLWPHYVSRHGLPASPPAGEGERVVRVMSFNTEFESDAWRAVADEVARHDPDILVLLEVGRSKRPLLEALEANYPHRADCLAEDFCQNVILSKIAFASSAIRTQWQGPQMVQVTYGPELGRLTVVGAHTMRPPFARRQHEQMMALGDELAAAGGAQIVAGDFNATPRSLMLQTLLSRAGLRLASGLASWPSTLGLPQIAIDHIMVSPTLRILAPARIGASAGSDHYPVIADIAVPLP